MINTKAYIKTIVIFRIQTARITAIFSMVDEYIIIAAAEYDGIYRLATALSRRRGASGALVELELRVLFRLPAAAKHFEHRLQTKNVTLRGANK